MDRLVFAVKRVFFETKSWRLFSFLFGLGFSFQLLSAHRQQQPFVARFSEAAGQIARATL